MDYECAACGDTGLDSKGRACRPCIMKGRKPLMRAIRQAINTAFINYAEKGDLPTRTALIDAIDWAFLPRIVYIAGYKDHEGDVTEYVAGPTPDLAALEESVELDDNTVFIVELTKVKYGEDPETRVIARWKDGKWSRKK